MKEERPIYVVGHKNPDTDSICAAIAYANLKKIVTGVLYEARRAGNLNEETSFVLKRFGIETPKLLEDVRTQVRDLEIRKIAGVDYSAVAALSYSVECGHPEPWREVDD